MKIKDFNPDKYKIDDLYRLHFLICELLMDGHLEQSSVTGSVMINDAKDATMSHVTAFSNPVTMKKSTTVLQVIHNVENTGFYSHSVEK